MPETVTHPCQYTGLMVSYLPPLPWCKAIVGYQVSSIIIVTASNNQPPTTDKQAVRQQD